MTVGYLNGVLMYVLSKAGNLCSSDFKDGGYSKDIYVSRGRT